MSITPKSIKLLWANAAGICSWPGCSIRLATGNEEGVDPYTVGEMAHIKGDQQGSNRHDPLQSQIERDSYSNLVLLCPTHHTIIDKPENEARYSVDALLQMKAIQEESIRRQLTTPEVRSREDVKALVTPYLEENRIVFESLGPSSRIARRNPFSDAHERWEIEKSRTIVPNNRAIAALLRKGSAYFSMAEQRTIASFLRHQQSYEDWVLEGISYESVLRFPADFERLMTE